MVSDGLKPGDRVIVEGRQRIRHGSAVSQCHSSTHQQPNIKRRQAMLSKFFLKRQVSPRVCYLHYAPGLPRHL